VGDDMMPESTSKQEPHVPLGADSANDSRGHRRGIPWFETLWQDVRFGLRMFRRNPGFAAVAILTLGLGIGATTAIFTVVDKVLLQPMAYPNADRIVVLENKFPEGTGPVISIPKFMAWQGQPQILEDAALYGFPGQQHVNLLGGDRPEQLKATQVSANFFSLFGVQFEAGRPFSAQEDVPKGPPLAVISNGLWRSRFGSDPQAVGKTLDLDGTAYTVVGVMAPFDSPDLPIGDVCLPLQADPNSINQGNYLFAAARLKPGVTLKTAKASSGVIGAEFAKKYPAATGPNVTFTVDTVHNVVVSSIQAALFVLVGAVAFVLLIACANVANLLLARATLRKREISIREALGAGRARIVRQVLTESVLLALAGGVLGLFIGYFGVRSLLAINPVTIPRIGEHAGTIPFDWRILVFALVISVVTGILFGLVPAFKASRSDLTSTLKESGSRAGTSLHHNKTRSLLVVTEMALAMILLVGAALLIRTFWQLRTVNAGFETRNILTMDMSLTGARFDKTAAVAQIVEEGRRRVEALPGVEAVAASCCLPLEGGYGLPFNIAGHAPTDGPYTGGGSWRSISPGYFDVFHIPLMRGRAFDERDGGASEPVIIINETMAKQFWPKGDELGARVTIGGSGMGPQFVEPAREVVGVVGDVRDNGLHNTPIATMYIPISQVTDGMTALGDSLIPLQWEIHSRVGPYSLATQVERELRAASGGLPVGNIRSMAQVERQSTALDAFSMTLLTVFAAIALLLAMVGIYGVMAYSVQQRTQEVGIRMALGASPYDVRRMVVLQGMLLAAIGLVVGVAGGLGLTRLMRSLLFEVKPWDPLVFVSTAVLLAIVALFACYVPAVRASRVDPLVALRYE
jgi:putative ABC transport system permease protein